MGVQRGVVALRSMLRLAVMLCASVQQTHSVPDPACEHVAVLIEPREHVLLEPVVLNVLQHLPSHWCVQIFHGTDNAAFIRRAPSLRQYFAGGRIVLNSLGVKNLHVGLYNALLTNSSFWRTCLFEKVLLFQTDTVICEGSGHHIDDFMHLDFVGAPWPEFSWWLHSDAVPIAGTDGKPSIKLRLPVGNGGFTLRSRSVMLSALEHHSWDGNSMEDVWFSHILQSATADSKELYARARIATVAEARAFALESQYTPNSFAVHTPQRYLSRLELRALYRYCPAAEILERHGNNPARQQQSKLDPSRATVASEVHNEGSNAALGLGFTAECSVSYSVDAAQEGTEEFACTAAHYSSRSTRSTARDADSIFVPLVHVVHSDKEAALACDQTTLRAALHAARGQLRGKAVGVARGGCPFFTKVQTLQEMGATAVVVIDNPRHPSADHANNSHSNEEASAPAPSLGDANVWVPVVMVTGHQGQVFAERLSPLTRITVRLLDANVLHLRGRGTPMVELRPMRPHHREATKEACDVVVDEGKLPEVSFAPTRTIAQLARAAPYLAPHTTVSVPQSRLGAFFEVVLPRLTAPVILVTTDCCSDRSSPQPYYAYEGVNKAAHPANRSECTGHAAHAYSESPRDWSYMLHHPRISHWFSDNWRGGDGALRGGYGVELGDYHSAAARTRRQKLSLLPIGISDQRAAGSAGDRETLLRTMAAARPFRTKPARAFANFHHSDKSYDWTNSVDDDDSVDSRRPCIGLVSGYMGHNVSRRAAFDTLHPVLGTKADTNESCVYFDHPAPPKEAWLRQAQHFGFVIAPHGRGLDTHRIWEALLLNAVPIVLRSPMDPLYSGEYSRRLPVKVVTSWSDVNCSSLAQWHRELVPLFEELGGVSVRHVLSAEHVAEQIRHRQIMLRNAEALEPWAAEQIWRSMRSATPVKSEAPQMGGIELERKTTLCRVALLSSSAAPVQAMATQHLDSEIWPSPPVMGEHDLSCVPAAFGFKTPLDQRLDDIDVVGVQHIPIVQAPCDDRSNLGCAAFGCNVSALRIAAAATFGLKHAQARPFAGFSAPFAVLAVRGGCSFGQKALAAQNSGAHALIVINANSISAADEAAVTEATGDAEAIEMNALPAEAGRVTIASAMLGRKEGLALWHAVSRATSAHKSPRALLTLVALDDKSGKSNGSAERNAAAAQQDATWRPDLRQINVLLGSADQEAARRNFELALTHLYQASVVLSARLALPSSQITDQAVITAALHKAGEEERALWKKMYLRRLWIMLAGLLWNSLETSAITNFRTEVTRDLTSGPEEYCPDFDWCPNLLPSFELNTKTVASACKRYARCVARQMEEVRTASTTTKSRSRVMARSHQTVRIGYVSAFLGEHPIGHLLSGIFAEHAALNHSADIFVYDLSLLLPDANLSAQSQSRNLAAVAQSNVTLRRISPRRSLSDTAKALSVVDAVVADDLDLMIDLDAWTRSAVRAVLPALTMVPHGPQIAHWLGQPMRPLGLASPYFFVCDATACPADAQQEPVDRSEKLLLLPHYYIYARTAAHFRGTASAQAVLDPSKLRGSNWLPRDKVVFACFNQPMKITPSAFDVWADILRRAPNVVLWFTSVRNGSWHTNRLRAESAARGIAPTRLYFSPAKYLGREEHLRRLRAADVALDTTPFNSGSVGAETLGEGVPLLSFVGTDVASRMGASLLRSALPFRARSLLLAHTRRELEDFATQLVEEPHVLRALRAQLQSGDGALFDARARTNDIEYAARAVAEVGKSMIHKHIVICSNLSRGF